MANSKRGSTPPAPPPPEEKEGRRDKFERIGGKRVLRIMNDIRLLGNLSSGNYAWTPNDIDLIRATIAEHLDRVLMRFIKSPGKVEYSFRFSDAAREEDRLH